MSDNKFYSVDKANTTDTWLTPKKLIDSLGEFDLDPCCPPNMPWKTAKEMYVLENGQDGLALPWSGRCWVNPPYSGWGAWLEKLSNHGNGIALIFTRCETQAFFDYIWNKAHSILFIKRRVKFQRIDGTFGGGSTAPSVLIAYGEENTESLRKSGIEGKLIVLE